MRRTHRLTCSDGPHYEAKFSVLLSQVLRSNQLTTSNLKKHGGSPVEYCPSSFSLTEKRIPKGYS